MKKLEDIPKKDIFNVPEGYFENLPGIIQSRVTKSSRGQTSPVFGFALKYGLAAVVIAAASFFWMQRPGEFESTEALLSGIDTQDLVAYINDQDMSTDELLDDVSLHQEDADRIEDRVFNSGLEDETSDTIFDEID
ncbi:MAG: hypothetical protein ABIS36_12440 [Chryseolinea sp.]